MTNWKDLGVESTSMSAISKLDVKALKPKSSGRLSPEIVLALRDLLGIERVAARLTSLELWCAPLVIPAPRSVHIPVTPHSPSAPLAGRSDDSRRSESLVIPVPR